MVDVARTPHRHSSETESAALRKGGIEQVRALSQREIDALWHRLQDRRRMPAELSTDPAPKIA